MFQPLLHHIRQLMLGGPEMRGFGHGLRWGEPVGKIETLHSSCGRQKSNPNCQAACTPQSLFVLLLFSILHCLMLGKPHGVPEDAATWSKQHTTKKQQVVSKNDARMQHVSDTKNLPPFDEDSSIEAMELPSYEDLGEPTDLSAVEVSLGRERNFWQRVKSTLRTTDACYEWHWMTLKQFSR